MELSDQTLNRIASWANGDHTGRSSMFLAMSAVADVDITPVYWPHDPADFKRCWIFMQILTPYERKVLLHKVALQSEKWRAIERHWKELCALWEEEMSQSRAPKLYEKMKHLGL